MSVETKPNKLIKGLVLDTFHTDVDNTVATYALNSQLEDQEGNHFHYGSEVGTAYIKDILPNHVVIGHINMERNETVLFTTDGTNSTIGILSKNDDLTYSYTVKIDDTNQDAKLNFKKEYYIRGVYRLLNGCDQIIYFVDGINKDRRINLSNLNLYKLADTKPRGKKKPSLKKDTEDITTLDAFIASLIAGSGISSNINLVHNLSSLSSASAIISADLVSTQQGLQLIDAILNGNATLVASIIKAIKLESIAISNATISSDITKSVLNSSSLNAIADTDANVLIARVLQTNLIANASLESILEVITQGLVLLDTSLEANSAVIASIVKSILLENYVSASANINSDLNLTKFINSSLSATSTIAVTTQLGIILNAQTLATSTVLAEAILSYTVNASLDAKADTTIEAQLSKLINLSVNAIGSTSIEAAIGAILLASITSTASVADAQLTRAAILNLIIEGKGTTDNNVTISKLMESLLSSSSQVSSTVTLSDLLNSTVSATAQTSATIIRSALVNSTLTGAATSTVTITLADILSTSLSAVSNVTLADLISQSALDLYFANTSLLIHADSGELQNNTFVDSSTNNFTITRVGNVTQGSFSPFPAAGVAYSPSVNGGSGYFDGSGDYLTISNNNVFNFGSGNFTIEFWIYCSSQALAPIVHQTSLASNTGWIVWNYDGINVNQTTRKLTFMANGASFILTTSSDAYVDNTWTHISIVKNGTGTNNINIYSGGINIGSGTYATALTNATQSLYVGGILNGVSWNGTSYFNGYISNLRILKGTAVYTTNFTPPTSPLTNITNTSLLLNFTNGGIIDQTGKNNIETVDNARRTTTLSKFGGSSILFDGTGDYLSIADNNVFNFGSENFTAECWVYMNSSTAQQIIMGQWDGFGGSTGLSWVILTSNNTNRNLRFATSLNGSTVNNDTVSSTVIPLNTWSHIALVRNGNVFTIYLDGTAATGGTYTITAGASLYNAPNNITIGASSNGSQFFNGYIDEIRITKGVARYTTNFTPPTAMFSDYGPSVTVDYLVVAGGGGGATSVGLSGGGGGGGAGGYRESNNIINTNVAYTITVGNSGSGGVWSGAVVKGTKGGQSIFANITSEGGGGGGGGTIDGESGGSGGGGGARFSGTPTRSTASAGYAGGITVNSRAGAGGGGAGAQAGDKTESGYPSPSAGTAGGVGLSSSITGSSVTRAGGGGGGNDATTGGAGGSSIGGNGGNNSVGGNAVANTGSGGGGGGTNSPINGGLYNGGSGGSGVVVLKIPDTRVAGFTVGVNYDLITSVTGYNIYNVKAAGTTDTVTFYDAANFLSVEYLVVAGGGSGGGGTGGVGAGGGGAGGYRTNVGSPIILSKNVNYLVTVGEGGVAVATNNLVGNNGQNSVFDTIVSTGGGGGGKVTSSSTGLNGGSGGGAGADSGGAGGFASPTGQGNNGGIGTSISAQPFRGGGGGGAGSVGANGSTSGNGGAGLQNAITGDNLFYAAGGGAGGNITGGTGGSSIGGNGSSNSTPVTSGTINTGSGGGGSNNSASQTVSGAGGSGVVIISYTNNNGNIIIPTGLYYLNSSNVEVQGNGTAVAPSKTPTGRKVYIFSKGSGNIQIT